MEPRHLVAVMGTREIGDEVTSEICEMAKANGLVIVYGYSDPFCRGIVFSISDL